MSGVEKAEEIANQKDTQSRPESGRPPVMLLGQPISWTEVSPRLGEAAGAAVLEELVIDALAQRELDLRGQSISAGDIQAEEALLTAAVTRTGTSPAQTAELMTQMKKARGLGPVRYKALLERNAILRRLVHDECEPSAEQVSEGMAVRYGPRYVARIIVTAAQQDAGRIHSRISALPEETRAAAFAAEAFRSSIDPSKDRGGLLEPISPSDVSYASGVRGVLTTLEPNKLSAIIALDNGYAILLGESTISGTPAPADAVERVRVEIRTRLERVAMDQLARRMLLAAPPTVFDQSMRWAWDNRR